MSFIEDTEKPREVEPTEVQHGRTKIEVLEIALAEMTKERDEWRDAYRLLVEQRKANG